MSPPGELESTLATLMRQLARQAVYLFPFMPRKAEELWQSLGASEDIASMTFKRVEALDPTGWRVKKGTPLFPKRETAATA